MKRVTQLGKSNSSVVQSLGWELDTKGHWGLLPASRLCSRGWRRVGSGARRQLAELSQSEIARAARVRAPACQPSHGGGLARPPSAPRSSQLAGMFLPG